MPIFAFLEQISKIDDENCAKTRISACWTFATAAYAIICVSEAVFGNRLLKQCKNAFFRHVEHLRLLQMPIYAFLEQISKIDDETSVKTRFQACLTFATTVYAFFAFLEQFSEIDDENTEKNAFFRHV